MSTTGDSRVVLDPSVAVLLLHLQNEVLDPVGAVGRHGVGAVVQRSGLFGAVRTLQHDADAAGSPVFQIVFARNAAQSSRSTATVLRNGAKVGFEPGGWGTRVPDALYRPTDILLRHDTMSAFAGTDLAATLAERGISRVVLGGVSTHLVVVATAFAASDLGLDVTVAADCCASPSEEIYQAALNQLGAIGAVTRVKD